jgi:heptosyltransferase-2
VLHRLLVRLPNWLGDALMARPVLHALRAAHREAEIVAVAPAALLDLLVTDGVLDRLEPWPVERPLRAALARRLRRWRPEAALVLPPSFSSAWFAWRSAARLRVGFAHEARAPLLTHALPRGARGDLHQSREFVRLGEVLGAKATPVPELRPLAEAGGSARELLDRRAITPGERYAILAPRSAWGPAREWPAPRFAAVGQELAARGFRIVICGAATERDVCAEVARVVGVGAVSLAGETGLPVLLALCASAALAVCNDSGLAHLAAATGTPTVQIYGSASSAWTHALGPRVSIVCRAPVCSPCYQRTCRIGYACLAAIAPAYVLEACDRLTGRDAA